MASSRVSRSLVVALLVLQFSTISHQFTLDDLPDFLKFWSNNKEKASPKVKVTPEGARSKRQTNNIGDSSIHPYEVEASQLPMKSDKKTINDRYMPVLGNGLLATTVYSNTMYINGLYNGAGASSHRARIPAIIMTRIDLMDRELERKTTRRFKFNVRDGLFTETIDCPFAFIEHRTYLHQKYIRVLVTHIVVKKKPRTWGGTITLVYPEMNATSDIRFDKPIRYDADWKVRGRTVEAEFGSNIRSVHVYYFQRQRDITIRNQDEVSATMIMAADVLESPAKNDFDKARELISQNNGVETLFREHKEAWKKTWERGKIEIQGNLQLAKITLFAQYYLLSSMPPLFAYQAPMFNTVYYGISRNSLGKGGTAVDYNGHIFWDNEIYIFPAILLFHPDMAKYMLRIRSAFDEQAREYAQSTGAEGYRYPWESAYTGRDVTPDTCPRCKHNALHVTAAVGWSIRQYYSATGDRDYMKNPEYNGCDMTREIAKFWASRCVYNTSKGRYDINDVMGPDQWHPKVNNNAYTNVMASLAIHWGRYFACLCDRNERTEVPDEWIQKALYVDLPFDNVKRLHYQFEGFENLPPSDQFNEQADTIMLTYPVNWNMSRDIMRNDLEYYESLTSDHTPAMTWSFFTVGWKWAKEEAKMYNYFLKSYQDYMVQPFKVWTEYNERTEADQLKSSVNFLPGMGAFLQSLIYGFAGIRIRPEFMEFHEPTPPPDSNSMTFKSFEYQGTEMDIEIHQDRVIITVLRVGDYELILKRNDSWAGKEQLSEGSRITIDKPQQGFYILSSEGSPCDHPRDYIFMPWGYSPWIAAAASPSISLLLYILTFLTLVFTSFPQLMTSQ